MPPACARPSRCLRPCPPTGSPGRPWLAPPASWHPSRCRPCRPAYAPGRYPVARPAGAASCCARPFRGRSETRVDRCPPVALPVLHYCRPCRLTSVVWGWPGTASARHQTRHRWPWPRAALAVARSAVGNWRSFASDRLRTLGTQSYLSAAITREVRRSKHAAMSFCPSVTK